MLTHLECTKCNRRYERGEVPAVCECGGPLFARYDLAKAALEMRPGHLALREPTLWRYREVLPIDDPDGRTTLGEGLTPLLEAPRLGARVGLPRLLIKDEGGNPTGSVEARGIAVSVSMAKTLGARDLCLASNGDGAAALAAYAGRAGLAAHVFVPRDIAPGVVLRVAACGAELLRVEGSIADAASLCSTRAREGGWYDCTAFEEPYRLEGKKTLGYELAEQFGWALPDAILYPTGAGAGLVGMWKAFAEMLEMGFVRSRRPRLYAVQPDSCAPLVKAFQEGLDEVPPSEGGPSLARNLCVAKGRADALALRSLRESHGATIAVSDAEILQGVKDAAASEGVLMAPEGGACVAAAAKLKSSGHLSPDDKVVVCNTGAGFNDEVAGTPR